MKRILVSCLSGIGDTLIATPLFHELRIQFPDAEIHAAVLWPGARGLLAGNPHLTAVHQHDFIRSSRLDSLEFVAGLRHHEFDLSITTHTQGRREYRLIARLIAARRRLSHQYENWSWIDDQLVTDSIPQDYSVHGVINNQRLLGCLGLAPRLTDPVCELSLTTAETDWASDWLKASSTDSSWKLGIHVGSGGTKNLALRRWPLKSYADLCRRWLDADPCRVVFFFGGPEESAPHAALREMLPTGRIHFPQTPSLRHAAALIQRCQGFLSVDTALMHVAAAVQTPRQWVIETPTLNPPVHPRRKDWVRIPNPVVADRPLDWYRYDGRPIAGTDAEITRAMESVTVDAVLQRLSEAA